MSFIYKKVCYTPCIPDHDAVTAPHSIQHSTWRRSVELPSCYVRQFWWKWLIVSPKKRYKILIFHVETNIAPLILSIPEISADFFRSFTTVSLETHRGSQTRPSPHAGEAYEVRLRGEENPSATPCMFARHPMKGLIFEDHHTQAREGQQPLNPRSLYNFTRNF